MKKLMSTGFSPLSFNTSMLAIRLVMGILLMSHGYQKLVHFSEMEENFFNLGGIGTTTSLLLAIFAEFFCALFIVIGLFTRLVSIPIVITMIIIVFKVHRLDFFDTAEKGMLFLTGYLVLLLCGPGKISVDGIASK